eukprot:SM000222S06974  [mRNA]  locus=s222:154820:158951:+ [translate_table: standard]
MYQWRRLQFFEDRSTTQLQGAPPAELRDSTCSTSGRGQAAFGTPGGAVLVVGRGLQAKLAFRAHAAAVLHLHQLKELVVGRDEAVYFYGRDGRGPCLAFEGPKRRVASFRGYLLTVKSAAVAAAAAGVSQRAPDAADGGSGASVSDELNIYDLKNKLVVYAAPVTGQVAHVLCEWGAVVVVLTDGSAMWVAEKDVATKLEMLFRKNLYSVAMNLIGGGAVEAGAAADVARRYADHLYAKQDYGEAMVQYAKTVGHLEPSYVIQRYLDPSRIADLTHYLEALHAARLATADHTTLLLNCYTKLKDVAKLDEFIRSEEAGSGAGGPPHYDVETVVRVCRMAGYFEHAMAVAAAAGEHEWHMRILIEDLGRVGDALDVIAQLPLYEAAATLRQYGKALVEREPERTADALVALCTGAWRIADGGSGGDSASLVNEAREAALRDGLLPSPMEFARAFTDCPAALTAFLERFLAAAAALGDSSHRYADVHDCLLELYLVKLELEPKLEASSAATNKATAGGSVSKEARQDRALILLQSAWPTHAEEPAYNKDLALMLCQMAGFVPGLLLLYERMRLYKEVLATYMAAHDTQASCPAAATNTVAFLPGIVVIHVKEYGYGGLIGLIGCCKRLGNAATGGDPSLWADLLAYFGDRGEDCGAAVAQVLEHLEGDKAGRAGALLSPLVVLQTLARNPHLTLGVVRGYVSRQLAADAEAIEEDRAAIVKYQEHTAKLRVELEELRTSTHVFQASKCSTCSYALDLPAVHFFCQHSYHHRCLSDGDSRGSDTAECPICAPGNRTILDTKRSLEQGAGNHDRFFQQVLSSSDGFSVIAEYFGRGLMNKGREIGTS